MDTRQALPCGSSLALPAMNCTILKEIGRGSNAIVYQASYPDLLHADETHTVLIKELFPLHPHSAIYRAEDGSIAHTEDGEELWQQHRRSFEYGNRIHLRQQRRHPALTGQNWNSIATNGTLYTVLAYSGGRSLAAEMKTPETNLRRLVLRMQMLLDALKDFHDEGYLHLDIAPDNILLVGSGRNERVMLIDYNSVHSIGQCRDELDFSMKPGYTAPEIRSGRFESIGPATDLYSVTAVFFRCLTGAALTPVQMIRAVPPDVSDCPALRGSPEPVKIMVRQILFDGLQNLPKRRCGTVEAMQKLMQELFDRIEGLGVTHWALWEAGKKTVTHYFRDNPSFAFIKEDDLFPSDTVTENKERLPTREFIDNLLLPEGENCFLTAPGGMGKTTALLRTVWLYSQHYSPKETAIAYISLHTCAAEDAAFIKDRLLENLRFKAETQNYAEARHRLRELLDQPLQSRETARPLLLLLLDGLNEAQGSTESLLKEIRELASLRGVRILLTSRSGEAPEGFSCATLSPLSEESVAKRLSEKGLLLPESAEIRELLQTPMMLSLFLQSSSAEEKQLTVQSTDELIAIYFRSLVEKALRDLPEDSPVRWQTEAAVYFVLPVIAAALQKKPRLDEEELLQLVGRCYKLFSSRILRRAFPQWIGHSREIRGDTSTAEEWYGLVVHGILWKKLGLLLRTEQDGYQIPHQILCEYLARQDRENLGHIRRRRRLQIRLMSATLLLFAAVCYGIYYGFIREKPYDDTLAEQVLAMANLAYADAAMQYEALNKLLAQTKETPEQYQDFFEQYENHRDIIALTGLTASKNYTGYDPVELINKLLENGDRVSWSGKPVDEEGYLKLLALAAKREEEYDRCVQVLEWAVSHRNERDHYMRYYNEYVTLLQDLLSYDAQITDCLMEEVYQPHERDDSAKKLYQDNALKNRHPDIVAENDIADYSLSKLESLRGDCLKDIMKNGAYLQLFPATEIAE